MLSGRLNYGMKCKISSRRMDISYSSMNAYSRQEAIRRMPGQIKELMSPLKIVQVNSRVRPFVLLSANAMDFWISRSLISHLHKKNLSHFSEIWEHRLKGMTPSIFLWTTVRFILSMTKWRSSISSQSGTYHISSISMRLSSYTGRRSNSISVRSYSKRWSNIPPAWTLL